ncbi:hypothetical protein OLX02_07080 [Novosphingobium sp. KCTC 2891]|uniref:hypothetical protein n=1 Tax=Novosphingobium sp. KCTC 2891 TaxID=2989730 RepID=UPI00222307AD|nr:hypothetical protein [Novosphingobium sp. KCTC 2891]MCW1382582.1 hypothetical protein [Novosphingobium sp. KCTC 2891]
MVRPSTPPRTFRTPRAAALALVLAPALFLGACADRSQFPSLARRPAERAYGMAQPVAGPTPASESSIPADATTVARVTALREQARKADARFDSRRPAALRAVAAARGAAVGSDAWSVAQIALADLDSARSDGMVAMADLDRMLVVAAQAAVDGPHADLDVIRPAHAEVDGLMRAELATLNGLRGQISG